MADKQPHEIGNVSPEGTVIPDADKQRIESAMQVIHSVMDKHRANEVDFGGGSIVKNPRVVKPPHR